MRLRLLQLVFKRLELLKFAMKTVNLALAKKFSKANAVLAMLQVRWVRPNSAMLALGARALAKALIPCGLRLSKAKAI